VRELEKKQMHNNVLQYEPEGALFVADDNALVFYKAIAEFGKANLIENGNLFFEINEYLGAETKTMLKELGYRNIELRKDINGKDRMIRCQN
jgi:release factor glutamine methyltransferase